jgi:hypothetical protein
MARRRYCPQCLSEITRSGARSCDECGLGKGAGQRERIEWLTDED